MESSSSSEDVHVDKQKDVCVDDAVVGICQERSPKRLEEDEDEDRLSSSSIVYILLLELRLELTGRGPCRQLPARRRDMVEVGKSELDSVLKHKSGADALKVIEMYQIKKRENAGTSAQ